MQWVSLPVSTPNSGYRLQGLFQSRALGAVNRLSYSTVRICKHRTMAVLTGPFPARIRSMRRELPGATGIGPFHSRATMVCYVLVASAIPVTQLPSNKTTGNLMFGQTVSDSLAQSLAHFVFTRPNTTVGVVAAEISESTCWWLPHCVSFVAATTYAIFTPGHNYACRRLEAWRRTLSGAKRQPSRHPRYPV